MYPIGEEHLEHVGDYTLALSLSIYLHDLVSLFRMCKQLTPFDLTLWGLDPS